MSLMASFCAFLFPRDVLGEICDLIESVSEGFPTYSSKMSGKTFAQFVGTIILRSNKSTTITRELNISFHYKRCHIPMLIQIKNLIF